MSSSITTKMIKEMAQLTAVTGRISNIQEQNLKMFPLIFFNDVSECNIEYDLSPITVNGTEMLCSKPHVSYRLTIDESKNLDLNKRFLALEKSVEFLFWAGIVVEVFFNGQLKYRSSTIESK